VGLDTHENIFFKTSIFYAKEKTFFIASQEAKKQAQAEREIPACIHV